LDAIDYQNSKAKIRGYIRRLPVVSERSSALSFKMKAQILIKPGAVENHPLVWTEIEKPTPRPNEVLLRVRACGICRTDLHVCEGELAPRLSPVIPGHQIVGVIEKVGDEVDDYTTGKSKEVFTVGERVGIAWLNQTCGACRYCRRGKENLCERAEFTGWTRNGGFAEYAVAPADFVYRLPHGFSDLQAAPLLCAVIIVFLALKLTI
jgi:propanol-preferring alcohol dehydrogenase